MGEIKINNEIYGTSNSSNIIFKDITVEEKLDTIPVFDINDNGNVENNNTDYLTYANILDNLNSTNTDKALSANQGKILNEKINTTNETVDNNFNTLSDSVDNLSKVLETFKSSFLNLVYPIGAIYISINSTSPAILFGGTWEAINDRFLLSAGSSYSAGGSGGTATHAHNISVGKAWATIGNYSETICFAADIGGQKWKDWTASTPYYWTHNADTKLTSDQSRYESGAWTNVYGETDTDNNMPPYLTVYMWKRVS